MRALSIWSLYLLTAWTVMAAPSQLGRVIKVLPLYLDKAGQHTVSPSLYARDAYQAELRKNLDRCSGLLFDVQWKAITSRPLKLRVEMRGRLEKQTTSAVIEEEVRYRGFFSKWAKLKLVGEGFKKFGELTAWRVSLWDGDQLLSEQKSFLW